jgi:hypothetical protein
MELGRVLHEDEAVIVEVRAELVDAGGSQTEFGHEELGNG